MRDTELQAHTHIDMYQEVLSESAGEFHSESQSMGNKEETHFTSFFICVGTVTSLALSVLQGYFKCYSNHVFWIFMDSILPSQAVKEKQTMEQINCARQREQGWRSVCVLILMQVNQWHSPKCLPSLVQGSQISVILSDTHVAKPPGIQRGRQSVRHLDEIR